MGSGASWDFAITSWWKRLSVSLSSWTQVYSMHLCRYGLEIIWTWPALSHSRCHKTHTIGGWNRARTDAEIDKLSLRGEQRGSTRELSRSLCSQRRLYNNCTLIQDTWKYPWEEGSCPVRSIIRDGVGTFMPCKLFYNPSSSQRLFDWASL